MTHRSQQLGLPLFEGFEPHHDPKSHIEGFCEAILYTDLHTGFTIAEIRQDHQLGKAVVAGKGDPFSPGDRVEADGAWEAHPKFGRQFRATYLKARVPETADGILKYLATGAVKGVGVKTAERLVAIFGDTLPQAMDAPLTLMAAGLTEVRAKDLAEHWKVRKRHGRLLAFLYSIGAGPAMAKRLLEAYGDEAYRILLSDPYRPAREVHGVGFKTADRMALSQGMPTDAPARVKAAILYILGEIEREGHCASPRLGLLARTCKELVLPDLTVEAEMERLLIQGDLVEERIGGRAVLYRDFVRKAEVEVAQQLVARTKALMVPEDIDGRIAQWTTDLKLPPLHEGQTKSVRVALASSVSVVTGNPGTGKTSTVSVLLQGLRALDPGVKIMLAAPTGRAAKRLTDQTGTEALTIHRLLVWSPEKRHFTKGAEDPLDCDVLVVDESSMLDIFLCRDLLRALPAHTRIVLVGDVDQLPSVGSGNVLSDVITSGVVPVARLTHIFRQGAGSAIATASQRINAGFVPKLSPPTAGKDMWGVWTETPQQAAVEVLELASGWVVREGFDPMKDLQVLAPGHQGDAGVQALNLALQARLNPPSPLKPEIEWRDRILRLHDRVIQTSNSYDLDVFNGDIGFIVAIEGRSTVVVDFDGRHVRYEGGDLSDLHLAYCITIHKSQGSEFPVVIVVSTTQHFVMLRRNLLYTGVSRARKLCCVVGQQRAMGIAVRKGDVGRVTGLSQRLSAFAMMQKRAA